ncbi:hypothetical protein D3C76_894630 [compost metagenome]
MPVRRGRAPDRPADQDAPATGRRHDHDRQAPPVLRRVRRGLRRRRAPARHQLRPGRQLRLLARPVRLDRRPRHVPLRQRLLPGRCHRARPPLQDQHRLQHRLPRLRRPAGDGRHRAGDGPHRPPPGPRPAGGAQGQLLRQDRTQRHPLLPDRRAQHARGDDRRTGSQQRLRRTPRVDPPLQRQQPDPEERPGTDTGQVRHFVHRHLPQPGRCTHPYLHRRQHSPEPRRHRNGPGPEHQGGPGGGADLPGGLQPHPDHCHQHRQGAQHLAYGCVEWCRPERQGGAERG